MPNSPSYGLPHPAMPRGLDARLALAPIAEANRRVAALTGDKLTSARTARRAARYQLAAWGIYDELADDMVVIVSELVANAITHSVTRPRARERLLWVVLGRYPGAVLVAVVDNGLYEPDRLRPQSPDSTTPSGRGLQIVAELSDRWGHLPHPQGTCVWASRDRARAEAPSFARTAETAPLAGPTPARNGVAAPSTVPAPTAVTTTGPAPDRSWSPPQW